MSSEITYVSWLVGQETVQIPIIDVTHPSFALDDTTDSRAALTAAFVEEEQPGEAASLGHEPDVEGRGGSRVSCKAW